MKKQVVNQWLVLCVACWCAIFMVGFDLTMWVDQPQLLKEGTMIVLGFCSCGCLVRAFNVGLGIRSCDG